MPREKREFCKYCGKKITDPRMYVYCSVECHILGARACNKALRERNKELALRGELPTKKKKPKLLTVAQIAKIASDQGISYGQFVARQEYFSAPKI